MKERKNKNYWFPSGIDQVLARSARHLNMTALIRRWRIAKAWEEVVGPKLARISAPETVYDDVLVVKVSTAPWANQMQYMKGELLQKLADTVGGKKVNDMRFIVGSLKKIEGFKKRKIDISETQIDPEIVARSIDEKALAGDPKLKKIFESLIENSYKIRKSKDEGR